MLAYIIRRLLLIMPTLFGIMADQFRHHPGRARRSGRADAVAEIQGTAQSVDGAHHRRRRRDVSERRRPAAVGDTSRYRGARGLDPIHQARSKSTSASTSRCASAS